VEAHQGTVAACHDPGRTRGRWRDGGDLPADAV